MLFVSGKKSSVTLCTIRSSADAAYEQKKAWNMGPRVSSKFMQRVSNQDPVWEGGRRPMRTCPDMTQHVTNITVSWTEGR